VVEKCGFRVISKALDNRKALGSGLELSLRDVVARPTLDTSIRVGNYRIHFDTSSASPDTPALLDSAYQRIPGSYRAYVESTASILSYASLIETNELGYLSPPDDFGEGGGPEYDIYVVELGNSYYGLTTPETPLNNKPDGGTFTSFMEIDNDFLFVSPDSNRGMPALRVTLAHELHHAIQIGRYGFWTGSAYFYELTSVWMEDVVFTEVNDYYQYLGVSQGQFRRPDISFTSSGFIMYSRGIWGHFIARRFGREIMKTAWEEVRNAPPLQAMDNALRGVTSSFRLAFSEWGKWNYFAGARADTARYYTEGSFYPTMIQAAVQFAPPASGIEGTLPPLSARYYEVMQGQTSFSLALSNINFDGALAGSTSPASYRYLLNVNKVDDTYRPIAGGPFVKLDVPDRTNWYDWSVGSTITPGVAFPNPCLVDGRASVFFAVNATVQVEGTLSIFTSSMDLVYSTPLKSLTHLSGQQVFAWNGRAGNGEVVQSGVYFFLLEIQNQHVLGKVAIIRQ
jgi:hypothetical protein